MDILFFILALIICIVPSILIFIKLKNMQKDNLLYRKKCNFSFAGGLISSLPIVILSGVLYVLTIALKLTVLKDTDILIYRAIYTFVVLALAEELIKFLVLKITLRKKTFAFTWADVTAFMVIIGTGFGLLESLAYAVNSNPMVLVMRGITLGHTGYGFIMGWFYGKRLYTGKKSYSVLAVLVPWLLHGLYDFSLSPELIERNENLMILAFLLAAISIATIVLMIRFFVRVKKQERYLQPIVQTADDETAEA